jgi:MFS family permease
VRKLETQTSRHGPSVLIYVLPALIDMVMALVLFVGTVRAVKLGGGATQAATVLAVWSLVYVVACPLIGRLVTAGNARNFILAGCGLFALSSGLLAAATGFVPMLALIGLCGVAAALFFPPFQVFMKAMDSAGGHSVAYSTGLYTFSWSTGFAFGPFIAGFLMQLGAPVTPGGEGPGWRYAFLFSAAVCLLTPWVLALAARSNRDHQPEARGDAPPSDATRLYESKPDLAWLGWLGAGAGFTALSIIRAVFPVRALGVLHLSESALGSVFFVLSMTQALMGLALMRSRFWMYRAKPVAAFALAGMAGILAFGFGKTSAMFLAGAVLFGIYTGAFCFYMVFHALVHPQRAGRYVSVNESLVGITGFLAPLAGGAMADAWGFQFPYLAAAGVTLAATGIQAWIHADSKGNA